MPAFEKGTSAKSSYTAVRTALGEQEWARVIERLAPDEQDMVTRPERHAMIPVSVTGRLYSSIRETACGGDRNAVERLLRRAGGHDADDMLDGVFSVFARFVSAQQAFKRSGSIVASVYSGVTSETSESADGRGGTLVLRGLGDCTLLAPLVCGWMEQAFGRFGAQNVRVTERSWAAGADASDELVFDVAWD